MPRERNERDAGQRELKGERWKGRLWVPPWSWGGLHEVLHFSCRVLRGTPFWLEPLGLRQFAISAGWGGGHGRRCWAGDVRSLWWPDIWLLRPSSPPPLWSLALDTQQRTFYPPCYSGVFLSPHLAQYLLWSLPGSLPSLFLGLHVWCFELLGVWASSCTAPWTWLGEPGLPSISSQETEFPLLFNFYFLATDLFILILILAAHSYLFVRVPGNFVFWLVSL